MTLKASTGLRNKLLDTGSFAATFNPSGVKAYLNIYDGPVPTTADAALDAANHLLVTISNNDTATGITFEASAVSGALAKNSGETWSGTSIAAGTATFYRLIPTTGDTGSLSTTLPRLQGSIATSGADLNMTTTTLTTPTFYTIDAFSVSLPTL